MHEYFIHFPFNHHFAGYFLLDQIFFLPAFFFGNSFLTLTKSTPCRSCLMYNTTPECKQNARRRYVYIIHREHMVQLIVHAQSASISRLSTLTSLHPRKHKLYTSNLRIWLWLYFRCNKNVFIFRRYIYYTCGAFSRLYNRFLTRFEGIFACSL